MAGSGRSRPKSSAERFSGRYVALTVFAGIVFCRAASADPLVPYEVVGDAIPAPLAEAAGDPARGRAIVVDRRVGLCLLCHTGPFPEERLQGSLAPDLGGVGARLSAGQLRLRIVDSGRVNPNTIMPPYYRIEGLVRVARPYAGKPILTAEQIEDVVAFLSALRE
jgi:L-cysteine S-thiosulfotransferase